MLPVRFSWLALWRPVAFPASWSSATINSTACSQSAGEVSTVMRRDAFSELVNTILLAVVVLAPAWAIGAEHLDPQLSFRVLSWVALVGIFVGMVCAYSDLAGEVVHPFTIVGGAAGVFYLITRIMPDVPPEASFHERLQELIRQIVEWFSVVIAGGQATNNLLFLLLLALVAWYIGYFGGWSV